MTGTHRDLALAPDDLDGATVCEVLRTNDKSLLAVGQRHGRPVVIKFLRTDDKFWRMRFGHEIGVYQEFTANPPPVRVPELVYTDGHQVLVIEHIPGHPADAERYPEEPLSTRTLDAVLDAVTAFAEWTPPAGILAPVFDYTDRVERYYRAGFFTARDRAALHALIHEGGTACQANHGDPLPANLLLTEHDGCALLDFEFTGLFAPGFDLAMLHALLAETPSAQDRIDSLVAAAGIEIPFLINQAMVLSRELRMYTEVSDDEFGQRRLAQLYPQWDAFRTHLHTWQ